MSGMFDINGDGHTDAGEEFMTYQMLEAASKTNSSYTRGPRQSTRKVSGFEIFIIILWAYQILSWIADAIY